MKKLVLSAKMRQTSHQITHRTVTNLAMVISTQKTMNLIQKKRKMTNP